MISNAVPSDQKHTRAHPCKICGGYGSMPRRKGIRCDGFLGGDGLYEHCERPEKAGAIPLDERTAPPTYAHKLYGVCKCGEAHNFVSAPLHTDTRKRPATRQRVTPGRVVPFPSSPARQRIEEARQQAQEHQEEGEWVVNWKQPTGTWKYRDASGALVYRVVRYPVVNTTTGELDKTYVPWRYVASGKTERQRWVKGLAGVTCILYHLPDLLAAPPERPVYLTEGEKCADALAAWDVLTTTTQGGANSWAKTAESARATLAGRHVVILPDNDASGASYARDVAAALYGVAASVRVLALPDLGEKGDIADWIAAGHTREELDALASAAPAYMPDTAPDLAPDTREQEHQEREQEAHPTQRRRISSPDDTGGPTGNSDLPGALLLCDTSRGALLYVDDAPVPGVYVAPSRRAPYCLLSAQLDISRIDAAQGARRGSQIQATVTPDMAPDMPVSVLFTQDNSLAGEVYADNGLSGVLSHIPTEKSEWALVWKAIQSLAAQTYQAHPQIRTLIARALGWNGTGVWVRVNGYIDREGAHTDGKIVAAVPESWPQCLPDDLAGLPERIEADTIRALLNFWPHDVTLFPLAMWGTCAYVMRLESEGRIRWELELFGPSGWHKTTLANLVLRAFYGAGYSYGTATQVSDGKDGDTFLGRMLMRSRLRYHAYLTYDHDKLPGQKGREEQQEDRIASAMATGNEKGGGARSTREGGLEMRPEPQGALVRTGEESAHEYTVPIGKWSADARCVTYVLAGDAETGRADRLATSRATLARRGELDALAILYPRWLASLASPAPDLARDTREQWASIALESARLVASEDCSGRYPGRHDRVIEQCENIAAGLLSYCAFLRAVDADTGTFARSVRGGATLAQELAGAIPELIRERLAASDDLHKRYEEAQGGVTSRDALATAVCLAIQNGLRNGWRITSQDSELPSEGNMMPRENPPAHLIRAGIAGEALGWERERLPSYNKTDVPEWKAAQHSQPLGCEYENIEGRYIACDRGALAALVREAAHHDKRVSYTTMARLLADLLAAGAIVGGNEKDSPYTQRVRRGTSGRQETNPPRMICFSVARIWPDHFAGEDENPSPANDAMHTTHHFSPGTPGTHGTHGTHVQETAIQAESLPAATGNIFPQASEMAKVQPGTPGTHQERAPDTREGAPASDVAATPESIGVPGLDALVCPECGDIQYYDCGGVPRCVLCDVEMIGGNTGNTASSSPDLAQEREREERVQEEI